MAFEEQKQLQRQSWECGVNTGPSVTGCSEDGQGVTVSLSSQYPHRPLDTDNQHEVESRMRLSWGGDCASNPRTMSVLSSSGEGFCGSGAPSRTDLENDNGTVSNGAYSLGGSAALQGSFNPSESTSLPPHLDTLKDAAVEKGSAERDKWIARIVSRCLDATPESLTSEGVGAVKDELNVRVGEARIRSSVSANQSYERGWLRFLAGCENKSATFEGFGEASDLTVKRAGSPYIDAVRCALLTAVPRPFALDWPQERQKDLWDLSLAGAFHRQLRRGFAHRGTQSEGALEKVRRFSAVTQRAVSFNSLDLDGIALLPMKVLAEPLAIALRSWSWDSRQKAHRGLGEEEEDEGKPCFLPRSLYLRPAVKKRKVVLSTAECGAEDTDRKDRAAIERDLQPQRCRSGSVWLWHASNKGPFPCNEDLVSQNSPYWGGVNFSGSSPLQSVGSPEDVEARDTRVVKDQPFNELGDFDSDSEMQQALDFLGVLSAYRMDDPVEQALAFSGLLIDRNADEVFATPAEVSRRLPSDINIKSTVKTRGSGVRVASLCLSDINNFAALHSELQPDSASSFIEFLMNQNDTDASWGPTSNTTDVDSKSDGDESESSVLSSSSSSSSLSTVVDDWGGAAMAANAVGGTTAIPMFLGARGNVSHDSVLDKKLQLKKRRQEKEHRIRLALMGLAPQIARAVNEQRKGESSAAPEVMPTYSGASGVSVSSTVAAGLGTTCMNGGGTSRARQTASVNDNPVANFRFLRKRYKRLRYLDRLRLSLDDRKKARDPYSVLRHPNAVQQNEQHLELRHSGPAFQYLRVPPRPFPVYVNRFHRPDFRSGLYSAHRAVRAANSSGRTDLGKGGLFRYGGGKSTASGGGGRFILHVGGGGSGTNNSSIRTSLYHANERGGMTGDWRGSGTETHANWSLWVPWVVRAPRVSPIMEKARNYLLHQSSAQQGIGRDKESGAHEEQQQFIRAAKHPADLIRDPCDLTLADMAPIALFEFSEQSPPLLNNIGMVARIFRCYRPASEGMTLIQAEKKIRGRLGRFGSLRLTDASIPFFGSQMRLAKNQGVVVVQSRLFKAPLFPHPTNPHSPLKQTGCKGGNCSGAGSCASNASIETGDARYGTGRFHDFRATDFLLVRSHVPCVVRRPVLQEGPIPKQGQTLASSLSSGTSRAFFYLRPLYLGPSGARVNDNDGNHLEEDVLDIDKITTVNPNRADCTVYTVGQTEPLAEVPAPTNKRCLEIKRDWLRAYALRLAQEGTTDFATVKSYCQAKFQNVFEPGVLQKHLMFCRDVTTTGALTSPVFYSAGSVPPGANQSGLTIRVLDEEQLRSICPPESLCVLESAVTANSQLVKAGLLILRSAERVSLAVRQLEGEETAARDALVRARKEFKVYETRFQRLITSLPENHRLADVLKKGILSGRDRGTCELFDLSLKKRCSPVARLIEEMLLLTPWNITRDCLDIVSRQGGQFTLNGIGDPSGGRGEALSLIRLQRCDLIAGKSGAGSSFLCGRGATNNQYSGRGVSQAPIQQSGISETPREDLRKLSMKELNDRLIRFGFDSETVKSLPRWDQVALVSLNFRTRETEGNHLSTTFVHVISQVRRFQCDETELLDDYLTLARSGRIPNDVYVKRLNEIFLNQRRALEGDEPHITASEDEDDGSTGGVEKIGPYAKVEDQEEEKEEKVIQDQLSQSNSHELQRQNKSLRDSQTTGYLTTTRRLSEHADSLLSKRKTVLEKLGQDTADGAGSGVPEGRLGERAFEDNSTNARVTGVCQKEEKVATANLEDELLSGLETRSVSDDYEAVGAKKATIRRCESPGYDEMQEKKALEEFRHALGKHRIHNASIPPTVLKRYDSEALRLLQVKPIPRLCWKRILRHPRTGEFLSERVVYIYGEENIKLFYEWRRRQSSNRRLLDSQVALSAQQHLGTASRTCRRCGQIGHISSNPICPQYSGPRKLRVTSQSSATAGVNTGNLTSRLPFHSPDFGATDDEVDVAHDMEVLDTPILATDAYGSSLPATTAGTAFTERNRRTADNASFAPSATSQKHNGSSRGSRISKKIGTRRKDDFSSLMNASQSREEEVGGVSGRDTSKLPTRTTVRQRHILESRGSLEGGAVQAYQGSLDSAINEINQIFQRVLSKTDRDKRKWAVFRDKISEAEAPGYFSVVPNPIWLNKMVEKCKTRQYLSTRAFLNDIQLLVDNCFRYNPPGHWIRPLVQSLGDFLKEETALQGPWLAELDRFIKEKQEDCGGTKTNDMRSAHNKSF